jgi:hypothetical protein
MTEPVWVHHENRIRTTRYRMWALLLMALLMTLLPFSAFLRPAAESVGTWWQRAGAPIAILAFLAQNKAQYLGALITPGSFTSPEMESLRLSYKPSQQFGACAASALTVAGTVIWGYGDLVLNAVGGLFGSF